MLEDLYNFVKGFVRTKQQKQERPVSRPSLFNPNQLVSGAPNPKAPAPETGDSPRSTLVLTKSFYNGNKTKPRHRIKSSDTTVFNSDSLEEIANNRREMKPTTTCQRGLETRLQINPDNADGTSIHKVLQLYHWNTGYLVSSRTETPQDFARVLAWLNKPTILNPRKKACHFFYLITQFLCKLH